MKTALLLSGHFRDIVFCYPSLKEQIIDVYNPDIFISSWNPGADFSHSLGASSQNINDSATVQDIISMLKPKSIKLEDFNSPVADSIKKKAWNLDVYGPMTGETNPVSIFCMWYKIQSSSLLMQEYEQKLGEKYDLVIKGRFDINLHDPVIVDENPNVISIPPGFDWRGGFNDIFAYGGREAMIHYCNMFDHIESYIVYESVFFHAETLLKHHLINSDFGVKRPEIRVTLRNKNIWEYEAIRENFKKI